MGFNSVVFICNDTISAIEKDPAGWWQKTWHKLCSIGFKDNDGEYGFGHCVNGFQAVYNQHADATGIIMVGGNHATVVDTTYGVPSHHTEEGQDSILIQLLEKRGYKVTKCKSKT